ncbi:hypothetical protein Q3O60_10680 [Alkalimonas collagenimarina]|uniref:Uncharacterized protein n=1 Tax=Alkalimonas collagenimarina TaxID=400390 RepID=A0ABT9H045_9GAMM|nr:hypothetical protein [Alkalimonas collagenimarina]MDP4536655.1 hypothetical protein [Alkalimonas collagenimarina]
MAAPADPALLASWQRRQAGREEGALVPLPSTVAAEVEQRLSLQDRYSTQDDFGPLDENNWQPEPIEGQWLRLQLRNQGGIPMPVTVQVITADDKQYRLQLPVDIWRAAQQERVLDLWLDSTETIVRIQLDPERLSGDVNPANQRLNGPLPIVLVSE